MMNSGQCSLIKMAIVDDEEIIREGMKQIINWNEYGIDAVYTARSGVEALECALISKPDIFLCDIRMSGMDGLTFINEAKKVTPDSLYIIISGYNDFLYAKKAIDLGAFGYLLKPVQVDELKEKIENCIKKINTMRLQKAEEENPGREKKESLPDNLSWFNPGGSNRIIWEIKQYIQKNIAEDINLNIIAEKFYYNPSYISRLFKAELGINFIDYIVEQKLEYAMRLLKETNYKFYVIAGMVGYKDYKYFSGIFRKCVKMTPIEYRNKWCQDA